jgi:hypothetical protein
MKRVTPKTSAATGVLLVHEPKDPPPPQEEPLTVPVSKACQLSGLGATTMWKFIRDGRLESVRVAGIKRTLITYESLKRLLTPCGPSHPKSHKPGIHARLPVQKGTRHERR